MQNLQYRRFGGTTHSISGKLSEMLNTEDITPLELFSVPNINGDIRQNVSQFLEFCARKRKFTFSMFQICFNSHYSQLQDQKKQKVAQFTIDVLSNDEDALSEFLFKETQTLKNSSGVSERIEEQTTEHIESQAERLFGDASDQQKEIKWRSEALAFEKYELIKLSLEHLKQQQKNETCLGYIHKMYSSILRREGKCFLEFLEDNKQYLDLLFKNLCYPSISNIVSLVLASEDKSGEYLHQSLKKQIFAKLLEYAFEHIHNQLFDGFIITVEEIFNSTKQSYYEYFEDFQRCANILVCQQTLRKFYDFLKTDNEIQFANATSFLELVIKRINNEIDQNDYYRQSQPSEPSMKFQHEFLFREKQTLFKLLDTSSKYNSLTRVNYLCLLINLLKNQKENKDDSNNIQFFQKTTKYFLAEKSTGMIKNHIYQLLDLIFKKMTSQQILEISKWITQEENLDFNVNEIRSTFTATNQDSVSCFILSILFQIQNKNLGFLQGERIKNKQLLKETKEKFGTKLADSGAQSPFQLDFVIPHKIFGQQPEKKPETQSDKEEQKGTHIGKNNIVIPSLNLPNRNDNVPNHNENVKIYFDEQIVEKVELSNSRQSIIQDLKNTIIQLPQKFKTKQKNQANENKNIEEVKIKKDNPQKNQKLGDEMTAKISNFYIRHLILF